MLERMPMAKGIGTIW